MWRGDNDGSGDAGALAEGQLDVASAWGHVHHLECMQRIRMKYKSKLKNATPLLTNCYQVVQVSPLRRQEQLVQNASRNGTADHGCSFPSLSAKRTADTQQSI